MAGTENAFARPESSCGDAGNRSLVQEILSMNDSKKIPLTLKSSVLKMQYPIFMFNYCISHCSESQVKVIDEKL